MQAALLRATNTTGVIVLVCTNLWLAVCNSLPSILMSDDLSAIKAQIQDHLVSLGNYDIISKQLKLRLYESGWFDNITQAASHELELHHGEPLNFERLYDVLRPKAEEMIPASVKEDVMAKIREYLDENIQ